jgi:thymidylate synthase (FAD)
MKLIKPSFEILEQLPGLEGMYKQIELAGRTCYKSEDKITEDSAKEFVDRMIKSGHGAMLEHGTVYLSLDMTSREQYFKYCYNKFSKANSTGSAEYSTWRGFVTTNLRVLVENDWLEDLQYICEPTEYHEKRHTVKFICDRGVSHEFVRHRVFSFAQESTRYCNYSKDKFSNEITYICPCWLDYDRVQELTEIANRDNKEVYRMGHDESLSMEERGLCSFVYDMSNHEHGYLFQISAGWKAQEARAILPNSLKTELVMTGFESDWKHFFELRCPGSAHPQARELAIPLQEKFKELKWVD